VPSTVNQAFHATVLAMLPDDWQHALHDPIGSGPPQREFERAYRLTKDALEWTGEAIGQRVPMHPNPLETVPVITTPEQGGYVARVASDQRREHVNDADLAAICARLETVGESLSACDTEAPNSSERPRARSARDRCRSGVG
jgi:hypothetical protein